jgi:predicted transcriptional regulator
MSTSTTVRLSDELLRQIDRERARSKLPRARVIHQALELWLERRRQERAIRQDQRGYAEHPVQDDEFEPVLGAQAWPK